MAFATVLSVTPSSSAIEWVGPTLETELRSTGGQALVDRRRTRLLEHLGEVHPDQGANVFVSGPTRGNAPEQNQPWPVVGRNVAPSPVRNNKAPRINNLQEMLEKRGCTPDDRQPRPAPGAGRRTLATSGRPQLDVAALDQRDRRPRLGRRLDPFPSRHRDPLDCDRLVPVPVPVAVPGAWCPPVPF